MCIHSVEKWLCLHVGYTIHFKRCQIKLFVPTFWSSCYDIHVVLHRMVCNNNKALDGMFTCAHGHISLLYGYCCCSEMRSCDRSKHLHC